MLGGDSIRISFLDIGTAGSPLQKKYSEVLEGIISEIMRPETDVTVLPKKSLFKFRYPAHSPYAGADMLHYAIMAEKDNWHIVEPREITVLDRIGGGDGFVGGMLYAILKGWEAKKWVQFGWASGALATTLLTDYAQPADEEQIWSIWEGNARVRR